MLIHFLTLCTLLNSLSAIPWGPELHSEQETAATHLTPEGASPTAAEWETWKARCLHGYTAILSLHFQDLSRSYYNPEHLEESTSCTEGMNTPNPYLSITLYSHSRSHIILQNKQATARDTNKAGASTVPRHTPAPTSNGCLWSREQWPAIPDRASPLHSSTPILWWLWNQPLHMSWWSYVPNVSTVAQGFMLHKLHTTWLTEMLL